MALVLTSRLRQSSNSHYKLREMQFASIVALALAEPRLPLGMNAPDFSWHLKAQGLEVDRDVSVEKSVRRDEFKLTSATGWPPPN
ncbi:MAG: hypothetical protein OXH37_10815 [Gammaproteobacteria bacterium]|nr:hypothetical protein [Gammaproteobacteria bacterium]